MLSVFKEHDGWQGRIPEGYEVGKIVSFRSACVENAAGGCNMSHPRIVRRMADESRELAGQASDTNGSAKAVSNLA